MPKYSTVKNRKKLSKNKNKKRLLKNKKKLSKKRLLKNKRRLSKKGGSNNGIIYTKVFPNQPNQPSFLDPYIDNLPNGRSETLYADIEYNPINNTTIDFLDLIFDPKLSYTDHLIIIDNKVFETLNIDTQNVIGSYYMSLKQEEKKNLDYTGFYDNTNIFNVTNFIKLIFKKEYNKIRKEEERITLESLKDNQNIFTNAIQKNINKILKLYVKFNIIHTDGYYDEYKKFYKEKNFKDNNFKDNKLKLPDNINFFDIYYYEKYNKIDHIKKNENIEDKLLENINLKTFVINNFEHKRLLRKITYYK